jgi:hypothetical protein
VDETTVQRWEAGERAPAPYLKRALRDLARELQKTIYMLCASAVSLRGRRKTMNNAIIDRVIIAEAHFYDLPPGVREMVRTYGKPMPSRNPDILAFEMARHRWEEINEAIVKATGGAS